MRTHYLMELNRKISTIDRNLTHSLFVTEQFLLDNQRHIDDHPESLTREVYSTNKYKEQFNYRLKNIPEELESLKRFTLVSSYVFAYSIFEIYIGELIGLVGNIRGLTCPDDKISPLTLFTCLGSSLSSQLDQQEIDTLDYIRLRRNSLVHAEGKPTPKLDSLIKKGKNLNSFWQGKGFDLIALDFASKSVDSFSPGEVIDLLRLIRTLASKIDQQVLSLLNERDIIDYALAGFKARFGSELKSQPRSKVEARFARDVKFRFDIDTKDIDFSKVAF